MKPSSVLCARLRFTTKEVGRGFYRGTRTGSVGAHTEYGGYVVDWRKVRNFNVPDLIGFKLTPFVTEEMQPKTRLVVPDEGEAYTPKFIDAMDYLQNWKRLNPQEWEEVLDYQANNRQAKQAAEARREMIEEGDKIYKEQNRPRLERERLAKLSQAAAQLAEPSGVKIRERES